MGECVFHFTHCFFQVFPIKFVNYRVHYTIVIIIYQNRMLMYSKGTLKIRVRLYPFHGDLIWNQNICFSVRSFFCTPRPPNFKEPYGLTLPKAFSPPPYLRCPSSWKKKQSLKVFTFQISRMSFEVKLMKNNSPENLGSFAPIVPD